MGVVDGGLLRIGQAVAKQVALSWLAEKKAASRRGRDLTALVRARFPLRRAERDVHESLMRLEDEVADQLAPGLGGAAHGLPDHERDAAYAAVADALAEVDLSNSALWATDLDPAELASLVRKEKPVDRVGLADRAVTLYDAALDRSCVVLVHLVRELPEFHAAAAVEQLGRLRTVLGDVAELLDRVPDRTLDAPAGTDFDEVFRRRYLDQVRRANDHLEVIGLTTHTYEPRTTLSVAYLSLTVTSDLDLAPRRESVAVDWLLDVTAKPTLGENLRVEQALGGSRLTVVRGEAGAGKSTLLRWLAVNAARRAFTDQLAEWNGCVPFLVKLRDFADTPLPRGDDLLTQPSSPHTGPAPAGWAHRHLSSGDALLLVDGVDELTAQRRPLVRQWLKTLLAAYPSVRVVVTSRPTAVGSTWLAHEGFRSVILEPMTPADVQVFLRRWHEALLDSVTDPALLPCRPDEVHDHQRALLAQLQARAHLRALARNPLLCAMLCALNLDRRARLPRDRVALYTAALDMLLERRDADRNVSAGGEITMSAGEKLVLLRVLAWWLNENGRTDLSRDQALARLRERLRGMPNVHQPAEALLDHLVERSGVIRAPVEGRIDFIHRTFQEFLAAQEAIDRDSIDHLVTRATSDLWRETVLMACAQGSADQRGRLLTGILDRAESAGTRTARRLSLLAVACQETATLAPPEVLSRLDSVVRSLAPPRGVRESRSLATVGEPVLDYLPDSLTNLTPAKAAGCVRTAALVNGPRALDTLAGYAPDPRVEVQDELIRAWKFFDPETYLRRVLVDAPLIPLEYVPRMFPEVDFPAAVRLLPQLRAMRSCRVNLWSHGAIDAEVRDLAEVRSLRWLVLLGDLLPATLPELARLTALRYLFINITEGLSADMSFLAELTTLNTLALPNAGAVRDLRFLRHLPHLEALHLFDIPVRSWLHHVRQPEILHTAVASGVDDTATLRAVLDRFPRLRILRLVAPRGSLEPLSGARLRSLTIDDRPEVDLAALRDQHELRFLRVTGTRDEVDLTPLAELSVRVTLGRNVRATGVDRLGPKVTLRRLPG
ncbi:hypothetical protein BLA60_25350 [Actinophytocola xinjiangensis]|uniref:NACHT domain-containing protein n=1 Tax=Actinophytocola xinjiangensis TaxID=485602 RepID=A0A7Z0WJL2_9PSEU|nr:NACHT domain-containing protein [Actinophytocola xinjiangensis]OLF08181.1 hypothetical protein BLA60_25350 [Actinophytocola xinjiangensis]